MSAWSVSESDAENAIVVWRPTMKLAVVEQMEPGARTGSRLATLGLGSCGGVAGGA